MRPPNEGEPIFTKQKLARTAGALLSAMTLSTIACGPERNPDAASFLYGLGEEGRLQGTPVVPTADGKWEIAQTPTVGSYLFVPMKGRVMGPNDNYLDNRKIPVRKNPNTYGEPAYELDPQQLKANHGVLVLGDSYPGRDGKTTLEINGRERQFGVWLLLTDDQGNSIDPSSGKPSETKYFVATVVVKNSNGTPVGIKEELVYVFVSNLPNNLIKPADGKPSFLPKDFKPLELEAVK